MLRGFRIRYLDRSVTSRAAAAPCRRASGRNRRPCGAYRSRLPGAAGSGSVRRRARRRRRRRPAAGVSTPSPSGTPRAMPRSIGVSTPCGHSTETLMPRSRVRERQVLGKAERGVLGRRIGAAADLRQQPGRRHGVEEIAAAARAHARHQMAGGIDMRHHVDRPAARPAVVRRRSPGCPNRGRARRSRHSSRTDRSGRTASRCRRSGGRCRPRG